MTKRKRQRSMRLATDTALAGAAASLTLWYRLPMFALTSLTPLTDRHSEGVRMVSEKMAAALKGSIDAHVETARIIGSALTGSLTPADLAVAPASIAAAAFAPAFRTVRANARRLHRKALT